MLLVVDRPLADLEPVPEPAPPPASAHPDIRRLFEHWRSIWPTAGRLPGRKDLDPGQIRDLLPSIWLIDVVREDGDLRFRYRLQGTRLVRMLGRGSNGQWIDEQPEFAGSVMAVSMLRCATARRPDWRRGVPVLRHITSSSDIERIYLPMASDGVSPDILLALTIFYDVNGEVLRA